MYSLSPSWLIALHGVVFGTKVWTLVPNTPSLSQPTFCTTCQQYSLLFVYWGIPINSSTPGFVWLLLWNFPYEFRLFLIIWAPAHWIGSHSIVVVILSVIFIFLKVKTMLAIPYFYHINLKPLSINPCGLGNYGTWELKRFSFICSFTIFPCQVPPHPLILLNFASLNLNLLSIYLLHIHLPFVSYLYSIYVSITYLSTISCLPILIFFFLDHLKISAELMIT